MYRISKYLKATDCLKQIIKIYKIGEIYLPYYLCDSVRHAVFEMKCKPVFYHIDNNFMIDEAIPNYEFILYPNYFGICTKNTEALAQKYRKLIVDNAHAFFNKPLGLACFNSAYKFNLDSCAYLWIKEDNIPSCTIPDFSNQKKLRYDKFLELHKKYCADNLLNIDTNSIPFCYPFLAKNEEYANLLVKDLKKEGKTIYRYWNPLPKNYNEYKFYSRLVPIPIM